MKIYFAHPAFTEAQRAFKARFLDSLRSSLGKIYLEKDLPVPEILDPFAYSPDIEDMPGHKALCSAAVASVCCRLMRDCFLVLAVADDGDTGVAFELGFAWALGIPAILVSGAEAADDTNAMLAGTSQARISQVLQPEKMAMLVNLIYGFSASMAFNASA
ncbi:MAG: nucleoside 2-deoxyribosyltransferase [Syntrophorhabdales bacterium]|jgi:nucleoside 2-deoxyribosyltransferase